MCSPRVPTAFLESPFQRSGLSSEVCPLRAGTLTPTLLGRRAHFCGCTVDVPLGLDVSETTGSAAQMQLPKQPSHPEGPTERLPAVLTTYFTDIRRSSFNLCLSFCQSPNSHFVTCRKFCLGGKQAICSDPTSCSELPLQCSRVALRAVVTSACE